VPTAPREPLQRTARLAIQGKVELDALREYMLSEENLDPDLADAVLVPLRDRVEEAIAQEVPSGRLQAVTAQLVNDLAPQLRGYYGEQADIIPEEVVERLLDLLQITGPTQDVLNDLEKRLGGVPDAIQGIKELRALFGYLDALGVSEGVCQLNFAMVRGLEYYTGPIYETSVREPKAMPSITGGGRYDKLIGLFSGVDYPATGTSLGIERIIDAMDELNMFPPNIRATTAEVLVTVFSPETASDSLKLATQLRRAGINTALYFEAEDSLRDQIGYASAKGIPFVVIAGPDEIASGEATIRKLGETAKDSEQRTVPLAEAAEAIRSW
jgi:histidyl-tRNA synthetase